MKMARNAGKGMRWLHEVTNIIHGDLKPANLLVSLPPPLFTSPPPSPPPHLPHLSLTNSIGHLHFQRLISTIKLKYPILGLVKLRKNIQSKIIHQKDLVCSLSLIFPTFSEICILIIFG
jgi:serine/threonine protein kinase